MPVQKEIAVKRAPEKSRIEAWQDGVISTAPATDHTPETDRNMTPTIIAVPVIAANSALDSGSCGQSSHKEQNEMANEAVKRERGRGSIFHNGHTDVWTIKYYFRGIPRRESSHSTDRTVAEKLLKRRLAEVETKTYTPRTNVKVDELITDVLHEYRREGRKTRADVESRWKNHLEPFFTRLKADDLNTDLVQRYCAKREAEGASGPTINRELAILKHAFNLATECSPPKVRAVPFFPMYKENPARKGFLSDEKYTLLARRCNQEGLWFRALLTTAYTFAFRKGELLNLKVRQVDLASREINLEEGTTKNGEPRIAPLTDEAATLLTALIVGKQKNDYVFTRPDEKRKDGTIVKGTPVKGFRRRWWKVCCEVGLGELVCRDCYPDLQEQTVDAKERCSACGKKWKRAQLKYVGLLFHDLRRSGVRNLIRIGVQQKVAMQISGHKTAAIFQRYNIIDKRDITEAGRKLNEKQNSNALLAVPVIGLDGHDSGMIAPKTARKQVQTDNLGAVPLPAPLPN
jgi:integrase